MSSDQQFLQNLYDAFNKREIETIISLMRPDVKWANGLEGGFVYGRDAVREYWTRQFKEIKPELETLKFEADENGRHIVTVHQIIRDMQGNLLADAIVHQIFTTENGLISLYEIGETGTIQEMIQKTELPTSGDISALISLTTGEKCMAKVTGIGGVFIKSKGKGSELAQWYKTNLGLDLESWGGSILRWSDDKAEDGGLTVWSSADSDTKWFSPSESSFMINYRVDDMDGLLEQLKQNGIETVGGPDSAENGIFAWIMDPDGNKVELWQPMLMDEKNKSS